MSRGNIDWDAVKDRLGKSGQSLKKALKPSAAQINSVYRKRAKRLAVRGAKTDAESAVTPVLSFWIGEKLYAIHMAGLAEVLQQTACTPVPGTPPELLGVVNLHGEIRPVLDASTVLGLPKKDKVEAGYIVFLRRKEGTEVGLKTDRIDEVRLVNEDELTIPASEASGLPGRFIKGVAPDAMILIDTEKMMTLGVLSEKQ